MHVQWKDCSLEEKQAYMDRFTLMDDLFMSAVLGHDKACTETVIQTIMENEHLRVESVTPQASFQNLSGHSVRLDILAVDAQGTRYDIEIQRLEKGASIRRARYYSSMLDASQEIEKQDYDTLRDTRVIFVTEHDIFGLGLQCYRIQRMIKAKEAIPVDDGTQIIYVNVEKPSQDKIGRLLHDFKCTDPDKMYNPILAAAVKRFKEFYKEDTMDAIHTDSNLSRQEIAAFWENHWCAHFREAFKEGREEGEKEGEKKGRKEGREEGEKAGRKKGRKEGREEGEKKGRKKGREEGQILLLSQLMKNNQLSAEDVVAQFAFSPKEREKMILALKAMSP